MLGGQEKMGARACSVVATPIKWDWGLVFAQTVPRFPPLQLPASPTPTASATLGTWEQMEPTARSVPRANIVHSTSTKIGPDPVAIKETNHVQLICKIYVVVVIRQGH